MKRGREGKRRFRLFALNEEIFSEHRKHILGLGEFSGVSKSIVGVALFRIRDVLWISHADRLPEQAWAINSMGKYET